MEPFIVRHENQIGWIEVVCGSMFSGKTEELIRRLKRAQFAQQRVEIFKPALDQRFSQEEVVSHNETTIPSTPVDTADQILLLVGEASVIGIDEAQFFGIELLAVCQRLADEGKRVIVAGLDQDYLGQPFEPIPQLMAVAEHVTKLHAICMQCGAPANHSQRLSGGDQRVLLGAQDTYEPRCRRCFERPEAAAQTTAPEPTREDEDTDDAPAALPLIQEECSPIDDGSASLPNEH